MGIKTVPQPPYSPDLVPCDFWLFPKLKEKFRGCRYETIEEMKEAVMKVIDMLTQEDFHGAFQKLLERYKCIAAGGDYFEGDKSFMYVLSIKVPIQKKSGNLSNEPCTEIFPAQRLQVMFRAVLIIDVTVPKVLRVRFSKLGTAESVQEHGAEDAEKYFGDLWRFTVPQSPVISTRHLM